VEQDEEENGLGFCFGQKHAGEAEEGGEIVSKLNLTKQNPLASILGW
jgi:hypothetical protein